jgi:hypothetical protein
MHNMRKTLLAAGFFCLGVGCTDSSPSLSTTDQLLSHHSHSLPNGVPIPNESGYSTTVSSQGSIDLDNEFFQNLGTNGRRCVSCHAPTAGWTIAPDQVQAIFDLTDGGVIDDGFGLGAIFRTNDGTVSPTADVSTLASRRVAYNMLLTKGLIRVGIGVPATADFTLVAVDDPYGHASAAELSLFRRPLPSTNLAFLSAVMWDGRETFSGQSIHFDLADQANGATQGHAQGNPLTPAQAESITNFESSLFTAQDYDSSAKRLDAHGVKGGADALERQDFYIGINDLFGDSETGAPFDPVVFDIYDGWNHSHDQAQAAIARGQALFNTRQFNITGVGGINDNPAFGSPASIAGTCSTCHNSPNAGDHSVSAPLDIGIASEARRTSDMPLYTFRETATGATRVVTDPGRALISGKFSDIGKFKGPILRGLAARAPYFHNGSAATLDSVVGFYNGRFGMNLTAQDKSDLVAFLRTL